MEFYRKQNLLCFPKKELLKIFEISKKGELIEKVLGQGLSFTELKNDYSKMKEISDVVGENTAQHRDEHEIFAVLFLFARFYEESSEICFEVDRFNPATDKIVYLKDLNKFRDGIGTSDFIIKTGNNFRFFQLKRYRGIANTVELYNFIQEKISHYGNNIGDTNLAIILQPKEFIMHLDFLELCQKIKLLNLKFKGEIFVCYNENDKKDVIIKLHPILAKLEIPLVYPSLQTKDVK